MLNSFAYLTLGPGRMRVNVDASSSCCFVGSRGRGQPRRPTSVPFFGRPGGISSSQFAVLRFHPPASNYEIPDHMSTPRGNAPLRLASNARAWVVWYWDTTSINDVHFGIEGANP